MIMLPFVGNSQSHDTVCIIRAHALYKLAQADSLKFVKLEAKLLARDTALLGQRVVELKAATIDLRRADSTSNAKFLTADKRIGELEKSLKKANRKAWWAAGSGIFLTAAAIIIPNLLKR